VLVGVCSDKGSPGSTTTALVLASAWPGKAVLVELDPHGGDLAIRLRGPGGSALPETPTVLTVATTARTQSTADLLVESGHALTSGLGVIQGPLLAEQFASMGDWGPLAEAMTRSSVPVFVDFGRLHSNSSLLSVAGHADLLIVVGRPSLESVIRLRERLSRLAPALATYRGSPPLLLPVLVSDRRHPKGDVADLERILVDSAAKPFLAGVGYLAFDPEAVARLESAEDPHGRLARTPLLRSAKRLFAHVSELLDMPTHIAEVAHLRGS
jgi:hypothetical protein